MRLASLMIVCLVASALAACAHDVAAVYPSRGGPTGTVVVELTNPAADLTVVVGGASVATRAHSQRVVVANVPAGRTDVDVAFGGDHDGRVEERRIIDVVPGAETTVAIAGPERSMAGALESGLANLGGMIFLGFVYAALL